MLIKIGLEDIPALTFAGLRYMLALLCLLPLLARSEHMQSLRALVRGDWARLVLLGLILSTMTQGVIFLGLAYLPAVTASLLLNLTTIVVAFFGMLLLSERPTILQWGGVGLNAVGLFVYFFPIAVPEGQSFGLLVAMLAVLTNAGALVLGRTVNRDGNAHPLVVTGISMGAGAVVLLLVGILVQGIPILSRSQWAIIA
jgi:drug/metabolite transporter (DMT)-like permease